MNNDAHSQIKTIDNNVYTWGTNRFGQCAILPFGNYTSPVRIDTLSNLKVASLACGTSHCVAALTSGEVYTFGCGTEGRLGLGDDGPRYAPCKIEAFGSIKISLMILINYHFNIF